jgi:hypothetical protein
VTRRQSEAIGVAVLLWAVAWLFVGVVALHFDGPVFAAVGVAGLFVFGWLAAKLAAPVD